MLHLIIGILCVIGIGFIAHRVGICLVRAVKLSLAGHPSLLVAILFSGLWVGAYSVIANINAWPQPFDRFAINPLFILGGFIFGVGSSVNQGCSISTLHHLARGNISMLFTMAGWFVGWCVWVSLSVTSFSINHAGLGQYQQLAPLDPVVVNILFTLSVCLTLAMVIFFRREPLIKSKSSLAFRLSHNQGIV